MFTALSLLTIVSSLAGQVASESHKVTFTNNCGHGTPKLIRGSDTLSTGQEYTSNGVLDHAIAYLDNGANGACGFNGEHCTMLELTLKNGADGSASSADISLIPDHTFSDPAGFEYTGGCAGQGAFCSDASCNTAYKVSNDDCVLVNCQEDDAGINIIFCGGSTHFSDSSKTGSPCHANSTSSTASGAPSASGTTTTTS